MFKILFEQIFRLITSPQKTWSKLAGEKEIKITDIDSFLKNYLYPVIGIVALLTFVGGFFYQKEFNIQLALRLTIKASIALFGGFYLASYILSEVMDRFFSYGKHYKKCQLFVGYSSALTYIMYMVLAVFPDFAFLQLILLYTFYMVWEGAVIYMEISENERSKFTVAATAIVLLSPFVIEKIIYLTMPGMRI